MTDYPKDTPWHILRNAGLTVTEAAKVRGVTKPMASRAFKCFGGPLKDARSERSRERMMALNADPEFNPMAALTPQ